MIKPKFRRVVTHRLRLRDGSVQVLNQAVFGLSSNWSVVELVGRRTWTTVSDLELTLLASLSLAEGVTVEDLGVAVAHNGPATRLTCRGELGPPAADKFRQVVMMAVDTDPKQLHLDTTNVSAISYEGVMALLHAARCCSESEAIFRLEPGPVVAQALDLAGLSWLGTAEAELDLDPERELTLGIEAFLRLEHGPTAG